MQLFLEMISISENENASKIEKEILNFEFEGQNFYIFREGIYYI